MSDIYFKAKTGQKVGLIGPNGSGKSTLLKNIYRVYQPELGKITIDDELLTNISTKKSAQKMAVVSQDSATLFDFPEREVVLMGRAPHKKLMETDNNKDEKIMQEALQKVGMSKIGSASCRERV